MNDLIKGKIDIIFKEVSFGKKQSVFKFYTDLIDLIELIGNKNPEKFLMEITTYHKDMKREVTLMEYIEHENNNKKNLYLCKILSLNKNYTLSGIDIFHGVFIPFIKESLTKKGLSKLDIPIYNELLSLENLSLLLSENIFRGSGNLNKFLKPLKKTNNYKVFEKNLNDPKVLSIFFKMFIKKKIKILMRDDWPYYFENLLNMIKNYPELLKLEVKISNKKIELQENMIKESPFLTYKYLKNESAEINNILPVYMADIIKKLNTRLDFYNKDSLKKFKEKNDLDFRLIQENDNWEHIILENGQDLLSIYCMAEEISPEKIEEWLSKKNFGNFLEKRAENFITDITKRDFDNDNVINLIKKYPFLNKKEGQDIILDSIVNSVVNKKTISLEEEMRYESPGNTYSILSEKGIPDYLIFGTLEQQKNWYMSNENFKDLYFFTNSLVEVDVSLSNVYLNDNGKKIREELYNYNNKQKDYEERNKYTDFIFECHKIHSIVHRYPTRISDLETFVSYLLKIDISADELKNTQAIKNIMNKSEKYKVMLNSVIEKKKLLEMVEGEGLKPISLVLKKRL